MGRTMLLAVAAAAWSGALLAGDDDLAVVRKAVSTAQASPRPAPPAEAPPGAAQAPGGQGKAEPRWFRVRVFERDGKGETRKRVSVNLPLSLVRAMDDFPIDLCRHHHRADEPAKDDPAREGGASRRRCDLRLGDVLAALEAGQQLVEIEAEEATVKVWVE